ncbi:MAG TPA: hypothetical protein VN277_00745 [Acidiferrobacterales bacterium]|nr:hypothetical protein [Acidiferrobacterales bacterium]
MRTATILVMITLLGIASAQANTAPAPGDNNLTGVPMSAAKRLLNVPVPSVKSVGTQSIGVTGVPMYRATRLLGSQVATDSGGAGASAVPLSGVSMVRAKRP